MTTQSIGRMQKRHEAIKQLELLMQQREHVQIIHYSCESFDTENAQSPRIVSIVITNAKTTQTRSFSIFQIAEMKKLKRDEIMLHYDDLEYQMLSEFYDFVEKHEQYRWVHWSMRDLKYGFPALEHRFKTLGGAPHKIPEENLFDLSKMLSGKYSSFYMSNPRMKNIMTKNNLSYQDYLDGAQEAEAFERGDFLRIHRSTLRKADNMVNILERAASDRLLHDAKLRDIYGFDIRSMTLYIKDHTLTILISVLIIFVTFILRLHELFIRFVKTRLHM